MSFDRTWSLRWQRIRGEHGVYYVFSSARGEATVTREKSDWAIRGVQRLGRTDARPIVERRAGEPYDWAAGVPSADYYPPAPAEQHLGRFEVTGLKDYQAAREEAYNHLALMPPRVPFSKIDDGTAEANRDKQFFQEQRRAFLAKNPYARIEEPETFYQPLVEAERRKQRARDRDQRESRDR